VALKRKPVEFPSWHLTDQAKMLEALGELSVQGWRGALTPTGSGAWQLELNADNPTRQVIAADGDWLVLDWDLRKLTVEECAEDYDEVT
jgi:hypothetical protein